MYNAARLINDCARNEEFADKSADISEDRTRHADACIYALGTVSPSKPEFNRLVNVDYTLAAARAFATSSAFQMESREGKKREMY